VDGRDKTRAHLLLGVGFPESGFDLGISPTGLSNRGDAALFIAFANGDSDA